MRIGSLVKHIEFGYTGIATKQGVSTSDKWFIRWIDGGIIHWWYTECELEVLCK